ncbi:MAG: glycosyltransferase family 1 protein [Cutibacterium avidum]|nr:glycosyltransferase family 1 protein [Cutibacterium avidum]
MRVSLSGRFIERNVGGNTTYARALESGLLQRGVDVNHIPFAASAPLTALKESFYAVNPPQQVQLIHYIADTGPLLPPRRPSVVTVHGLASRWTTVSRSRRAQAMWTTRVRAAIKLCDHVITVSHSSANDICEVFGVRREDISVIPHGFEPKVTAAPSTPSQRLSHLEHEPFVLYLGNIEPRKNLVSLAEAFDSPELSGMKLVVAGRKAWDFDASIRAFDARDNIEYLGFVSDDERAWLYQHCAIFVFPSHYEGFGLPVLEALGAGAPVACTRKGSLAEVAGPAATIEDTTTEAIASGLARALADTPWLHSIRHDGPKWAHRFSWDRSVDAHVEVYRRLCS